MVGFIVIKKIQISNISCIMLIFRNRRDFFMESVRVIMNKNNVDVRVCGLPK